MNNAVKQMLSRYKCNSIDDYENAFKEIIQEIALLGLWRSKFFEIGAFYGGTALRILHGLERFSEDMDFSLLEKNPNFNIQKYESSLERELTAFGFEVSIKKKTKTLQTSIESAFIKANTLVHLIQIAPDIKTHRERVLSIKIEVDTDPPSGSVTDAVSHFSPIPFTVRTFDLPTLFAGKIAAMLYRPYKFNTKGRDWFDFLWYVSRKVTPNLEHFQARITQLGKWPSDKKIELDDVRNLLRERIEHLNLIQAKNDVLPFVKDRYSVEHWTKDLMLAAVEQIGRS